ncbi:hypothetical protein [Okeania sp. SIO2B3]|uniref:hypothetical protein n=1 Tax=Okeania sp. SIO2B3 TaxID=2607784 RepID=UPI0013C05F0B|nr:hypothetical protein [Okeania sp. SIO2B3]NET40625.1 hypothetical protein [Okeania sp. SIO2B3]
MKIDVFGASIDTDPYFAGVTLTLVLAQLLRRRHYNTTPVASSRGTRKGALAPLSHGQRHLGLLFLFLFFDYLPDSISTWL